MKQVIRCFGCLTLLQAAVAVANVAPVQPSRAVLADRLSCSIRTTAARNAEPDAVALAVTDAAAIRTPRAFRWLGVGSDDPVYIRDSVGELSLTTTFQGRAVDLKLVYAHAEMLSKGLKPVGAAQWVCLKGHMDGVGDEYSAPGCEIDPAREARKEMKDILRRDLAFSNAKDPLTVWRTVPLENDAHVSNTPVPSAAFDKRHLAPVYLEVTKAAGVAGDLFLVFECTYGGSAQFAKD